MQTGVDTLETVVRKEEVNWGQTAVDLFVNFEITLLGNYMGGRMVPTNPGWFQPKKFQNVFTKPYGQKILQQTGIGAVMSGTTDFLKKNNWSELKPPTVVGPKFCFYPHFLGVC